MIERTDIGNSVVCDMCGDDWTARDGTGGILFGSKAACPTCAPQVEADATRYGETQYIRDRCPPGLHYREWVLRLRGGNNTVTTYTGDDADAYMRSIQQ